MFLGFCVDSDMEILNHDIYVCNRFHFERVENVIKGYGAKDTSEN